MGWVVVGMFFGVWVAALLAWPELTFVDQAWASFGRIRPVHTSGEIFGYVTPLIAALAMSVSSIVVVANALRLKAGRPAKEAATPVAPVEVPAE